MLPLSIRARGSLCMRLAAAVAGLGACGPEAVIARGAGAKAAEATGRWRVTRTGLDVRPAGDPVLLCHPGLPFCKETTDEVWRLTPWAEDPEGELPGWIEYVTLRRLDRAERRVSFEVTDFRIWGAIGVEHAVTVVIGLPCPLVDGRPAKHCDDPESSEDSPSSTPALLGITHLHARLRRRDEVERRPPSQWIADLVQPVATWREVVHPQTFTSPRPAAARGSYPHYGAFPQQMADDDLPPLAHWMWHAVELRTLARDGAGIEAGITHQADGALSSCRGTTRWQCAEQRAQTRHHLAVNAHPAVSTISDSGRLSASDAQRDLFVEYRVGLVAEWVPGAFEAQRNYYGPVYFGYPASVRWGEKLQ